MSPSATIPTRLLLCFLLCGPVRTFAQPKDSIKVFIIYGSKPAKGYPNERKWFGGRPGGHVALQTGPEKVLSFRATKYHPPHIFPRRKRANFCATYELRRPERILQTFNYHADPNYDTGATRHLIVTIPITPGQRQKLDSLTTAYLANTPYDYAVFGMRCASATYEVMARLGIFKRPFRHEIWWHLLYPRSFRYYLLKEMKDQPNSTPWKVYSAPGSPARKWDHDWKLR